MLRRLGKPKQFPPDDPRGSTKQNFPFSLKRKQNKNKRIINRQYWWLTDIAATPGRPCFDHGVFPPKSWPQRQQQLRI